MVTDGYWYGGTSFIRSMWGSSNGKDSLPRGLRGIRAQKNKKGLETLALIQLLSPFWHLSPRHPASYSLIWQHSSKLSHWCYFFRKKEIMVDCSTEPKTKTKVVPDETISLQKAARSVQVLQLFSFYCSFHQHCILGP